MADLLLAKLRELQAKVESTEPEASILPTCLSLLDQLGTVLGGGGPPPLTTREDRYGGVEIEVPISAADTPHALGVELSRRIEQWAAAGKRGLWLKIPLDCAAFAGSAAAQGFQFHHAKPEYVEMTRWLPTDQPSPLPAYAFTQVPTTAHPSRHQSVCRLSPTPPPAPSPGRRRRRRRQLRGPCADGAGARLGNTSADFRPPRLPRPTSGHLGCTSAHLGAGARLSDGEDAGQLETAGRASRAHRRARLFGGPFSDASRSLPPGGLADPGEDFADTVAREAREEAALAAASGGRL